MRRLVLVPGWGLTPAFWDPLRAALPAGWPVQVLTPDGEGAPEVGAGGEPPPVAVGHSMGVLWLLARRPFAWAGLVSINGFARFTRARDYPHGVPPRVLARMRARFEEDPVGGHAEFLRRCGHPAPSFEGLSVPALARGLDALADWDARGALAGPLLALAGRCDPIVPEAMSADAFGGWPLVWHEGGHLLPLTDPAWCAHHLVPFVEGLP